MLKKVCVISASRSEYDGLYPLLKRIKDSKNLKLSIVTTGSHLCEEFGNTYKKIEQDGFKISKKIHTLLSSDAASAINKSIALGMISFADYFAENKQDLVVVMGDRYELLSVCVPAANELIPIAHISGGETTQGAIDESIRHSITKFSYLHFVANEEYRRRVIQLGEEPSRVFAFGELSLENISKREFLTKKTLEEKINFSLDKPYVLVTFHPTTLEKNSANWQFEQLLLALDKTDFKIIFTKTNADKGGKGINKLIDKYVKSNPQKSIAFKSLGRERYLSAMRFSDMVIGNSSSGIYESPSFKIPSINIGDRQKGRVQSEITLNCEPVCDEILKKINKVSGKSFKNKLKNAKNPYQKNNVSKRILETIEYFLIKEEINLKKKFYDL
ncbi:MAG: UDP-N-acetylglucosamine 2-epimerase [Oscillospiraceae bacterium]|nr:UDP-N-acetylglucosamine 2-epimerase [Oscillospiraceae bacterium]